MPETVYKENNTSLRLFDSLYEQYADFCRKLRFLIKGAFTMEAQSLALEIIAEFLERKEKELHKLKASATNRIGSNVADSQSLELLLGRLLMEREDYKILQRIAEIRQNGGPRWEVLQSIIRDQAANSSPPVSMQDD